MTKLFDGLTGFQKGFFLTLFGVFFMSLGILGTRYIVIHEELSLPTLYFWSNLGAIVLALPFLLFQKKQTTLLQTFRLYPKLILISSLLLAISSIIWFYLISQIPADTISLFDQFAVFWSIILGTFFLQERTNFLQFFALIICSGGILLIYQVEIVVTPLLFCLLLFNSFLFALQSFLLKVYGNGVDSFHFAFFRLIGAFFLIGIPLLLFQQVSYPSLFLIAFMGVVTFIGLILGRMLVTKAHEYLPISQLNFLFLLMPVFLLVTTPFIERDYIFEIWKYVGAGLVLFGMIIFLWKRK